MSISKKMLLVVFVFLVLFVPLGVLSTVRSESLTHNLEDKAFACLTNVYSLNLTHYNITADPVYTLSRASDTSSTQAVNYKLNSPDSNLVANLLFKDGALYQLSLSVINGSVSTARSYDNLTDLARDFLVKYQTFSGADSTDLIRLLDHYDETKNTPVTLGNTSLSVSHLAISTVESVTTGFDWVYTLNGADNTVVGLTFGNSTFGGFFDSRQLYTVGSKEAISIAMNYIENYSYIAPDGSQANGFNVNKDDSVAKFFALVQNGTMQPCWEVTLNLTSVYPRGVNVLQLDVLANSGEVVSCHNQSVSSLQVTDSDSNMNSSVIEMMIVAIAALTIVVGVFLIQRRKQHSLRWIA